MAAQIPARTDWVNGQKVSDSDMNALGALINTNTATAAAALTAAGAALTAANKSSSKLLEVGNHGYATSGNISSTSTAGTSQIKFKIGLPATGLRPVFQHWYTPISSFFDTDPAGPIIFSADIRILTSTNPNAILNTPYRLTFAGRTTATLDPGGEIIADAVGVSVLPGDIVAVRTYLSSGTAWVNRTATFYASDVNFTANSDLTMTNTALGSGVGNVFVYGPAQLLGRVQAGVAAGAYLVIGDSISSGYGDSAIGYRADLNLGGWQLRALSGKGGLVNAAVPGDRATVFATTPGSLRRIRSAERANIALINYGANDFGIYSTTAAALESLNLSIASDVRKMGTIKVYIITLLPRTTSTDGWLTTANQTPLSSEPQRVLYNTWARAGCPIDPTTKTPVAVGTPNALINGQAGHPVTGVLDFASVVESAFNSGVWAAWGRSIAVSASSGNININLTTGTLTASNAEVGGDIGQNILIFGAGASGGVAIGGVATVTSPTAATITIIISTAVTAAAAVIGGSTNDGTHPSTKGHQAIADYFTAQMPIILAA